MNSGVWIAAGLTGVLAVLVFGVPLWARTPPEARRFLVVLAVLMLPMHALVFHGVRLPLDHWFVSTGLDGGVPWFVRVLYAPLTEEPAKLWPLLLPSFRGRVATVGVARTALAIGLGFGIGEAWTVAGLLAEDPRMTGMPWWMLGGYIGERLIVCLMHAAFTASILHVAWKKRRIAGGILLGMLLHLIANLPIALAGRDAFGLGQTTWAMLLQAWVMLYFLAMGALLAWVAYGRAWGRVLLRGTVRCPGCNARYAHPIFGINLLHRRYERCPHCRAWHLVSAFDESCA